MRFGINIPQVIFGEGASLETGKKLKEFGITKVLCVYDKGVKAAGIVDDILKTIHEEGIVTVLFDGVLPDPPDTLVDQAAELGIEAGVDGLLGIGGGSTMDTTKAINILLGNPGPVSIYFDMSIPQKPAKPLFLIPTTSGTGSEVTGVAVLSNTKKGTKQGILGKNCTATLTIVDPALTLGVPPHITAATGMDVFSHAAEALTASINNPMSDILALEAITLVTKYLPVAVRDGSNLEARTKMSFASMIAGISFNNSMTHIGHSMAHSIGAKYHVPHGTACAIATPGVVEFVSDIMPEKIKAIGNAMGLNLKDTLSGKEAGEIVAKAVRDLNRETGIPTLKQLNIPEVGLAEIAAATLEDGCIFFSPKKAMFEEVLKILKKEYAN